MIFELGALLILTGTVLFVHYNNRIDGLFSLFLGILATSLFYIMNNGILINILSIIPMFIYLSNYVLNVINGIKYEKKQRLVQ